MHPDSAAPCRYPDAFCCAMTVQHTGTHFLGATLLHLTGHGGTGWPQSAVGPASSTVGYRITHLYGRRDEIMDAFVRQWLDGTDLPVVVTLRHPQASMSTFLHRHPKGQYRNGYGPEEHVNSFRRLAWLLGVADDRNGTELAGQPYQLPAWGDPERRRGRVHAFRVDCPRRRRERELWALLGHVWPEGPEARGVSRDELRERVRSWAERWPRINARGAPSVATPRVPDEIVTALGYRAWPYGGASGSFLHGTAHAS